MPHVVSLLFTSTAFHIASALAARPKNKAGGLRASHLWKGQPVTSASEALSLAEAAKEHEEASAQEAIFERTLDELAYAVFVRPPATISHRGANATVFGDVIADLAGALGQTASSAEWKFATAQLHGWWNAVDRAKRKNRTLASSRSASARKEEMEAADDQPIDYSIPPACAASLPADDPYWKQSTSYCPPGKNPPYNVCMYSNNCTKVFSNSERVQSLRRTLDATRQLLNKHGTTYMLFGGSVIGAYRCSDVLPWDLDNDVAILQKDFAPLAEWFAGANPKEAPHHYRGHQGRFIDLKVYGIPGFSLMEKFRGCIPMVVVDQSTGFFTDMFPMTGVHPDRMYSPWYAASVECDSRTLFGCDWWRCDSWSYANTLPASSCTIFDQQQACPHKLEAFLDEYYGPSVKTPNRTTRSAAALWIRSKVFHAAASRNEEKATSSVNHLYYVLTALVFIVPCVMWFCRCPKVSVVFTFYLGLYMSWAMLTYATRDKTYNTGMLVLNALLFKLVMSLVLWRAWEGSTFLELPQVAWTNSNTLLQYVVPAGLYALSDIIRVEALQATDASTFAILFNSRTLFLAFVWQWCMKRRLHAVHWVSMGAVLLGCCLKELPHIETNVEDKGRYWAYFAILVLGVISSIATVWNEMLLQKRSDVGVSLQNMAMYIWGTICTMLVLILWMIFDPSRVNSPFDVAAWIAIWGQPLVLLSSAVLAVYGVATAYFLRYLSNITREVCLGALAPLFSVAMDLALFKLVLSAVEYGGLVLVASGVILFAHKPVLAIDAGSEEIEKADNAEKVVNDAGSGAIEQAHDAEKSDMSTCGEAGRENSSGSTPSTQEAEVSSEASGEADRMSHR